MMIGARTAAWAKSGGGGTYPYLTSESIAAWDAEWNEGYNVPHNTSTTRWKDLVGNRDFNLHGGYSWNVDSLHFNGSSARGDLSVGDSEIFMSNEFVVECVFSQDEGVNVWGFVFGSIGGNPGYGACIGMRSNVNDMIINTQVGNEAKPGTCISKGDDYFKNGATGCITFKNNGLSYAPTNIYINNHAITADKTDYASNLGQKQIRIGARYANGYSGWFKGRIMRLQILTSLTEEERKQHYTIDKARFNLPDAV